MTYAIFLAGLVGKIERWVKEEGDVFRPESRCSPVKHKELFWSGMTMLECPSNDSGGRGLVAAGAHSSDLEQQ